MLVVIYLYWKRLLMFPKQKYCCKWRFSGAWCHLVFEVHEPISWSAHSGSDETLKNHLLAPSPSHSTILHSLSHSHISITFPSTWQFYAASLCLEQRKNLVFWYTNCTLVWEEEKPSKTSIAYAQPKCTRVSTTPHWTACNNLACFGLLAEG